MSSKSKTSFSELKVGIFVVIACFILAVAIFTIGTEVGLLQDTFVAKTYLNTVSGLKPGNVVLLGGVEIGNVTAVNITRPGETPETPDNLTNTKMISEGTAQISKLQAQVNDLERKLMASRLRHTQTMQEQGEKSQVVQELRSQLKDLEGQIYSHRKELESLQRDVDDARNKIQNIEIYLEIISDYRDWIKADSNISLGSVGLLGDKYIEISIGRTDRPATVIREKKRGWIFDETQEVLVIEGTRQTGFQELVTGANDILTNFKSLSERLEEITGQLQEGEGTVGKFFSDPAFYNNLNAAILGARGTVEGASRMIRDITEGPGTVPRLIQEREIYDRIVAATSKLETTLAKVESGDGTIGQLVNDPALYGHANRLMENAESIAKRIEAGQGTLGKLSTDDKLYRDLQASVNRLSGLMQDVEQGKGTLGRLAKDPELYQNVNQLSSEMVKLIYDFRQNPKKFLTIKFEIF